MIKKQNQKESLGLKNALIYTSLPNDNKINQQFLSVRNPPLKKIVSKTKTERDSKFNYAGLFFFPKLNKEVQQTNPDIELSQSFSIKLDKQCKERQDQIEKFRDDMLKENKFLHNQLEKFQPIHFKKSKRTQTKYKIQKTEKNLESLQLMLQCRIQKNIFNDVETQTKNDDNMKNCLIQNCVIDSTNVLKEDNRNLIDLYGINPKNTRNNNLILEEIILSRLTKNKKKKLQIKQTLIYDK